jgi:hypothetical protein
MPKIHCIYHPPCHIFSIMLSCCRLHQREFWEGQPSSVISWMQSLLGPWAEKIALTLGGKSLQWWGCHQKSVHSLLDEKGHCLAASLLSVLILSLSEKPKLMEQNARRTNFQKFPYPSILLSGCSCSLLWYLWIIMVSWLFQSLQVSVFDFQMHFHNRWQYGII